MRIEKGYRGWGADLGTGYTILGAGLGRFADMTRGDFIGRDAVAAQAARAPDRDWIGIGIDEASPEPLASDPILRDVERIGYVTSASRGYRTGSHPALGCVRAGTLRWARRATCASLAGTCRRHAAIPASMAPGTCG